MRHFGCTDAKNGGSRRSSLKTNSIRDGTNIDPLILVKNALIAPIATIPAPQGGR